VSTDTKALYSAPGYILFVRQGILMAQAFDAARLQLTGESFPIAENVRTGGPNGRSAFSVSDNGILTYRTGSSQNSLEMAWFDRSGKQIGPVGQPGDWRGTALSPDEKRLAVHRHETAGGDIWLLDFLRSDAATRFTFDAATHYSSPVWSPDGNRIAYNGGQDIYVRGSSGGGNEELWVKSGTLKMPMSWSSDGRFILYEDTDPKTKTDLWILPTTGDHKPEPYLQTEFNETKGHFSPDGKWVVYTSDESGKMEIYVQTFPRTANKWRVSTNGGALPLWRKDGKEIFFFTGDRKLWSVDVKAGTANFEAGVPRFLFESRVYSTNTGNNSPIPYAVSGDGQRFLITSQPADGTVSEPITVSLNWYAGFKQPTLK
jgi:Tol biopolymer transport system component